MCIRKYSRGLSNRSLRLEGFVEPIFWYYIIYGISTLSKWNANMWRANIILCDKILKENILGEQGHLS